MAKPQLENGYTMLANEIIDAFTRLHLSGNEWRVLWVIIRKTYGFHKKVDKIANSQIIEATGLHKGVVSRSIKKLYAANVVFKNGKMLGFQKDYELWFELEHKGEKLTELQTTDTKLTESSTPSAGEKLTELQPELTESLTKVNSSLDTQKKKETLQKERSPKGDHRIKEILYTIEQKLGQQIPFYAKEGAAVKRALNMGFTPEEILGCWETMRGFEFWQGKWLSLAKVTENLGEYKSGRLRDGANKARRVTGGRPASDFERGF